MAKIKIVCKECGKVPAEISEYIHGGKVEGCTPEEFVIDNEGTFNKKTGKFYCTSCYVKIGCPQGKA